MPCPSVGEKLPLVTTPTTSPSRVTGYPCRGIWRPSTLRPAQPAGDAAVVLGLERRPPTEVALVEAHHPGQAGLQRGDPRPQLVPVQRQPRFEAQRVAGAQPGRRDAGVEQELPAPDCGGCGHVQLDAVLAGVAGARDPARARPRTRAAPPRTAPRRRASGAIPRQALARLGTLHRQHRTRGGDVVDLALSPTVEDGRLAERVDERLRCSTRSASPGSHPARSTTR